MKNLFIRGSFVELDKKKGIIPERNSILSFWKNFRTNENCPLFYKKMNDDEFISQKLSDYELRPCLSCLCQDKKDIHCEYVVFFVDPFSNEITGEQDTHVCQRRLKLWKD